MVTGSRWDQTATNIGHFGRRYTPEERRIAGDILNVLCADDTPLPIRGVITSVLARDNDRTPAMIEGLLWRLVDEFYLAPTPATVAVQFSVPIFRRWWERWGHT